MDANGKLTRHHATALALTGEVDESESVRQLLTDFYREIASENRSQDSRLFAEQFLEQQAENGYASATACQQCHEQEYLQWSATRHAFAYETLLKKERYFDAGCVPCHTTGSVTAQGFRSENKIQLSKVCSVKRATDPVSSTSATRKRVISAAGRIHRCVSNATTLHTRPASWRWWHCIPKMSIIAMNR